MLHVLGPSQSRHLSQLFERRAKRDGDKVIFASMGQFHSSEAFSEILEEHQADIQGQPVNVVQSFARASNYSANDLFTQMLMVGDTLKRYGAGPLWASVPFGPYARQDQERKGKMDSLGCDMAARHLALDYEGISTVELHSDKALELLKSRFGEDSVFNLYPTNVFAKDIKKLNLSNLVVISPDKGANARADALADKLDADRFCVDKERSEVINLKVKGYHGDVAGRDCIMVDDMADTMGTAVQAAELVRKKGAASLFFYSAHPVLSHPAWDNLAKAIRSNIFNGVKFGNTIARGSDRAGFEQQYGAATAGKVSTVNLGGLLYDHVVKTVAKHPKMQVG